jgi:hypothetical protein
MDNPAAIIPAGMKTNPIPIDVIVSPAICNRVASK